VKFELKSAVNWFDSGYKSREQVHSADRIDLARCMSLVILHLGCLGVIWVGWSWFAVAVAAALYFIRMFAITAFLHRYFSHRSFKTSRLIQFVFAIMASTAVQRGALWWASHHRKHHQKSDSKDDVHSPNTHGFIWSHIGWLTSSKNFETDYNAIKDFAKYPETAEAWLQNMDLHESEIRRVFAETYGSNQATKWWVYWRVFYMACSELWNTDGGEEWIVSHYLFKKTAG